MRKLFVMAIAVLIVATACSSGKYADKIDKAVNKQQAFQKKLHKNHQADVDKKFDKKDANIYVFENGKYVMIAYKPLKNDAEAHYYTYQFKDGKVKYVKDFNSKGYYQKHKDDADYEEENMNLNE
ncbi:cystatin-like fold lipoprotein [Staphylococcus gallinarum]|uniref:cystatin-like fold lipoprotein n=1 Tax=Staphylococcus gallinarum TaxID=1293 RepID=UPI000D1C44BF|nr:cystatin-like fold lipoprotein [Staphylococcus gallinarum]MBU7217314.1 DUF4467 domain-containing protein [Staphylococcus gallinarum]MCD8792604.1 DUF4467 domain-containing protein [Staphylococcus gallinarum]MCD8829236.1 DUF4467 domain-containing protein [Staphylococcus gallinarum]MCD8845319.1 DUF4467 domain-containing protein [Staphylococcus gallinarum]MCD8918477.1 DUF4467 domain-containing protein [Staphylococcus gallinarum]